MANSRDFTGKNRKFTGTKAITTPKGTTGERVGAESGELRFNTTTNLMEYYDGTQWKAIDAPPTISSVSPATFVSDGSTIHTITVTGGNFGAGLTAKFIGQDGTEYTPGTTTVVSLSSVTMTTLTSMTVANEPYDIKITNVSGLFATLENALDAGSSPAFTASAGSLGTLSDGGRAATGLTSQTFGPATDADGQQIRYSITSGSLPPGLRLGTANDGNNGKILGTATAVVSDTTSSFTISATDGVNTASRAYSITVNAPVVQSFTATGAFSFSVPVGVTAVQVLAVAGGGGAAWIGGGAGGGGVVYHTSFPVTPGGTVPGSVGAGGPASPGSNHTNQSPWDGRGGDSTFGSLTAKGGGSTAGWIYQTTGGPGGVWPNSPGGSGGGGTGQNHGGIASQPGTPNPGATNYGFPGAAGGDAPPSPQSGNGTTYAGQHTSGGGGGAGAAGGHPTQSGPGNTSGNQQAGRFAGNGVTNSISGSSVTYAGGGAGGSHNGYGPNASTAVPGGTGGGGQAGPTGTTGGTGGTNTGGGGGGAAYPDPNGGAGGPGIVILKF